MLFTLPEDTIGGILSYITGFFDSVKIYIFLALGLSLGFIIISFFYDLAFGYKARVKREAHARIAESMEDEEEEQFEEDVEQEMEDIMLN